MNFWGLLWGTHKIPSIFKINIWSTSCLEVWMDFASILAVECWSILSRGCILALQSLQSSWLRSVTCSQIPRVAMENTPGNESSGLCLLSYTETIWANAYIRMLMEMETEWKSKRKQCQALLPPQECAFMQFFTCLARGQNLCVDFGGFFSVWIFWLPKLGRLRRGLQQQAGRSGGGSIAFLLRIFETAHRHSGYLVVFLLYVLGKES